LIISKNLSLTAIDLAKPSSFDMVDYGVLPLPSLEKEISSLPR